MKLGLPDGGSKPTENTERKAYDLLTEGFGAGFNGVLTVVVDAPEATKEQQKQIATEITRHAGGDAERGRRLAAPAERGGRRDDLDGHAQDRSRLG